MRALLLTTMLLAACGEGGDSSGGDDTDAGEGPDPGVPHFRLTVNGVSHSYDEAWTAIVGGGRTEVVAATSPDAPDRDSLGLYFPAEVGLYDCATMMASYGEVRNTSDYTAWSSQAAGAVCELDVTAVSDVAGEPIAGTFTLTLPAGSPAPAGTEPVEITDGSFRIPSGTSYYD
jgi:hypothetical protein